MVISVRIVLGGRNSRIGAQPGMMTRAQGSFNAGSASSISKFSAMKSLQRAHFALTTFGNRAISVSMNFFSVLGRFLDDGRAERDELGNF
jgi:hypothetical protein